VLLQEIEDRYIDPSVIYREREVVTDGAIERQPAVFDEAEHSRSCDEFGDRSHALGFEWRRAVTCIQLNFSGADDHSLVWAGKFSVEVFGCVDSRFERIGMSICGALFDLNSWTDLITDDVGGSWPCVSDRWRQEHRCHNCDRSSMLLAYHSHTGWCSAPTRRFPRLK